ncbi:hypothetical protein BDF19DRAFT_435365 [Syncephalis fuscata]|nr:hypothetical protein BDF19DRAFT_435365 [Syncephalis fuscata]
MEALDAYTQAASAYTEANSLQPDDAACLYNWGRVLFILGGFVDGDEDPDEKLQYVNEAITKFEASVKRQPDNTDALFNLAQALATRCDLLVDTDNDRAAGEPLLRRAIKLFDQVYQLQEVAAANADTTMPDDNTADNPTSKPLPTINKNTLVDTVSTVAECITSLACLQETSEQADSLFDEACQRLERALELSNERRADILCDWAAVLEAKVNHQQQQQQPDTVKRMDVSLYDPVIAKLQEAIEAGPTLADPRCDLGDLYLGIAHGRLIEATFDADLDETKVVTVDATTEEEMKRQAEARIAAMDGEITPYYEKACAAFKEAAELEISNVGIRQKLGDIYFARSRLPLDSAKAIEQTLLKEAEHWYQQTLEAAVDDPEPIIRLAQVYEVQGRKEEYIKLLDQWNALGGTVGELYEEDDVFEMGFIDKVAKQLETKDAS